MNNLSQIEECLGKINATLEGYLKSHESELSEVMKYTLMAPGKKIRPLVMTCVYNLCGGKSEEIFKFAAAIEMIHAYSLIHDDLPCMDDGETRRGKPCSHLKFGESTALLAGDALLTGAFEIASTARLENLAAVLESINILAALAGTSGMVLGQYEDLKGSENILEVYKLKTANLFIACSKIGAVLAGASIETIKIAEEFGFKMGVLFQLADDLIDEDIKKDDLISGMKALDFAKKLLTDAESLLEKIGKDNAALKHFLGLISASIK